MLIHIENVISADEAARVRAALAAADWIDGRATAGAQSALAKDNLQLPAEHRLAVEWGDRIVAALQEHPLFMAAALPLKVFPPLFNRYNGGQSFGTHVDNAIRAIPSGPRLRTDLSATLFLTSPDDYDGGELIVEDTYGTHAVKLPAGHLVLYPATSLHRVEPVTRGSRISSFFWIQSMIRGDQQRSLLLELDLAVQRLSAESAGHPAVVQLTGVYHNLIRMWAEL